MQSILMNRTLILFFEYIFQLCFCIVSVIFKNHSLMLQRHLRSTQSTTTPKSLRKRC